MAGKWEKPIVKTPSLPAKESLKYPEHFTVSKTPKGRYKLAFGGTELSYSLATKENVNNMIILTQQALIQYESCKAQHNLLDSIRLYIVDCKFSHNKTLLWDMNIAINDSILWTTDFIEEEQFTKALTRMITKNGKKNIDGIKNEGELYYFWDEFISFINKITLDKKLLSH